jgi:hypothetical protein
LKLSWRGIIGIALSAVLLWWTLRDVSLAVVWQELRRSNGWLFLLATFMSTIIFPLRARRWQTILEPVAPGQPFSALWKATAVGMMANNVLPARAGEIARAYALTHQTKVPLSTRRFRGLRRSPGKASGASHRDRWCWSCCFSPHSMPWRFFPHR